MKRKQATGDPFGFQFEAQDYILPSEAGEAAEAHFPWTEDLHKQLVMLRTKGQPAKVVAEVAEVLRKFLQPAGWAGQAQQILAALEAGRPVELLIRSAAAEMYALPWELLPLRPGGPYLGELPNVLLRYAWPACPATAELPRPRPEGGRILLAWSAAGGAVPAAEHTEAIQKACAQGVYGFESNPAAKDADVLPHASVSRLVRTLEQARQTGKHIAVLHLLCHGTQTPGSFGLSLDGEDGRTVVDGQELRQVLAPFSGMVRLVVLSACDSGNTGAAAA